MHAKEQTLKQLLEGEKQYVIPLYQRTYSWQRPQIQQLWEDVLLQADALSDSDNAPGHFLGSVVLAPSRAAVGEITRWLVVDGQQRLTTLNLALCALRDHVRATDRRTADRIHRQFLINEYQDDLDQLKVLPTQDDRSAFQAVVAGDPGAAVGNVMDTYRIFRELMVAADDPDDPHDMTRIEQALVSRLDLVAITTDADDNVHRIFQSLNNTGMQLTQGDLLRNHYFMLLPHRADDIYTRIWRPMEKRLGANNLETLALLDLLLSGFEKASRGETYRLQAERIRSFEASEDAVESDLTRLSRRATALQPVLDPGSAPTTELAECLKRLLDWGADATQVVMLAALEKLQDGRASEAEVARVANLCESFLVRRMLSGRSAAGINRIMAEAARVMLAADDTVESLHAYLSAPRRGWAPDAQLRAEIQSRNFYWTGRASQRMFVLRRLEESFDHKEPVDWAAASPTIEHVLPQAITTEWLDSVIDESEPNLPAADVHQKWVHRIGNLTLTSYNPELSNNSFRTKRERFRSSHFEMTRQIADVGTWGPEQIASRADALADRIISIWPAPLNTKTEVADPWREVRRLLVALPVGTWTTYGDIAAVTGHHAVPLGQFLAGSAVPNAWRVLTVAGKISDGFRWPESRTETPRDLLESEGVTFDRNGSADPSRRLRAADLAELLGLEVETDVPAQTESAHPHQAELFWRTIRLQRDPDVVEGLARLVMHWTSLGGSLMYCVEPQLALYPILQTVPAEPWPLGIYPGGNGTIEVPFQWLKIRPPFDATSIREEMLARLNAIDGIDIPTARLGLRPRFPLALLGQSTAVDGLKRMLSWFVEVAREEKAPEHTSVDRNSDGSL